MRMDAWSGFSSPHMTQPLIEVRVASTHAEAVDVVSLVLQACEGELPAWTPGSHVDVHLPNGMVRSYSISAGAADRSWYRITVQRDANGRGGSISLLDELKVGSMLKLSPPRNNFELSELAPESVFISGGIGVTPFLPMIARLNELGRPWKLYYCARTQERAPLLQELRALESSRLGRVVENFDGALAGQMLNISALIEALAPLSHIYCCGPVGMLSAFRSACAELEIERVHFEYFNSLTHAADAGGYTVVLARSGRSVPIKPGDTILASLRRLGVDVPYSCEEGVCGACQTTVLSGTPEHRDMILTEKERASGKLMMICCSGSKSKLIELDL
jgi:tetrachlorobenzoquinone reductase